MAMPIATNPLWPDKEDCSLPIVQPLPLINRNDPWYHRLSQAMFRRPQYLVLEDYFTFVPSVNAWCFLPKNFIFDFASVPRPLTFMFEPAGFWAYPAGPHDFGYRFGGLMLSPGPHQEYSFIPLSRYQLDLVFKSMANKSNRLPGLNAIGTVALRVAGSLCHDPKPVGEVDWNQHVWQHTKY